MKNTYLIGDIGRGFFRILGYGLTWRYKKLGLTFSEREGLTKYHIIGKWIITFLKRGKQYGG